MRFRQILTFLLIFTFFGLHSMYAVDGKKSDIKKLNETADESFYNQNYYLAYECYDQLQKLLPEYENYYDFRKGSCLVLLQQEPKRALNLILNGKEELENSEVADEYLYYLAKAYHLNYKFDNAIETYQKLINLDGLDDELVSESAKREIEICENAKKLILDDKNYEIINLGDSLNSKYPDYKPSISTDESTLIFTSRRENNVGNQKDIDGRYFEDIKISHRNALGYWSAPQGISNNINTENHEASVTLSADGTQIIFYKGNNNSGELYTSSLQGNDWGTPAKIDDGKTINTKKYWEASASLSTDYNTIYFSTDRKGSLGGVDLYKSVKNSDGKWGKPVNLGSTINTQYDEESPYIHPDGKTLYFASKGHNSIGGFDIFKSTLENGQWSTPENLGYPINSVFDDVHFTITANGKKAYFCSLRENSIGAEDIYSVILDEDVRPLVLIKGIVKTEDKSADIDVDLSVFSKDNNQKQKYIYKPNRSTGKYLLILPPGKEYTMFISAEGYENYEISLNIPDQDHFHEFYQEITLRKKSVGDTLMAQEITIINSFDDLREKKENFNPELLQPDPSYLKELMEDLVYLTDSLPNDAKGKALAENRRNQLETATDNVTQNFKAVVETKSFTETLTYNSSNYLREAKVEPKVIDGDTFMVIPSDLFVDAADYVKKDTFDQTKLASDKSNLDKLSGDDARILDSLEKEKAKLLAESKNVKQQEKEEDKLLVESPKEKVEDKKLQDEKEITPTSTASTEKVFEDMIVTVYYAFNKIMFEQKHKAELDQFIKLYKSNNASKIIIEGHTDAIGSDAYNDALSKKRAESVAAYFRTKGIPNSSFEYKAYGEQRPASPNTKPDGTDNPEGRSLNRRSIVRMVK